MSHPPRQKKTQNNKEQAGRTSGRVGAVAGGTVVPGVIGAVAGGIVVPGVTGAAAGEVVAPASTGCCRAVGEAGGVATGAGVGITRGGEGGTAGGPTAGDGVVPVGVVGAVAGCKVAVGGFTIG